jgi:hypothetical protein
MDDVLRRCARCNRPRDNSHPTLCPICMLRKMQCQLNEILQMLTKGNAL